MFQRSIGVVFNRSESKINQLYKHGGNLKLKQPESVAPSSEKNIDTSALLKKHYETEKEWTTKEIKEVLSEHSLFTWGSSNASLEAAIQIKKAEGVHFWDTEGKKYLDFNSQAMCMNLGYSNPSIAEAVSKQMNEIAYTYPCKSVTAIKAQVSGLLADLFPGDLSYFYYPSGGSEANETAIRIARQYTGKHKILARYRSYHGGTLGSLSMTGDFRRWYAEPGMSGVVHLLDPYPYTFNWGVTEEEITAKSLAMVRETIMYEGPNTIAAFYMEAIPGTNGILKPPKGYLEGIRSLCDEFNILMVCDEVMGGFGRTGELFAFMHSDPLVIPDIVTSAKGINGAYLPQGCVAVRKHLGEHFRSNPLMAGSTYNSHPVAMASVFAGLKVFLEKDILSNVRNLAPIMEAEMNKLAEKHISIKQGRNVGLFGAVDIQKNSQGDWIAGYTEAHPAMTKFHSFYTNPPLVINEKELKEGFEIIDKGLKIVDDVFEG